MRWRLRCGYRYRKRPSQYTLWGSQPAQRQLALRLEREKKGEEEEETPRLRSSLLRRGVLSMS